MKLLIVTQVVDTDDPKLGFFHHWLEEFSQKFESIQVICLTEGRHALPSNVSVHSLGKEHGRQPRVITSLRFLKLAWKLRNSYDAVFVHMNPEYVLVAGYFWRISKKKVGLWYNHTVGSLWLRLAAPLVSSIFHTSSYAYPARYKKAVLMPAGVDTQIFKPLPVTRDRKTIYFQGRVSPAKNVHILLEAVRMLRTEGIQATVTIVGPEDADYGAKLRSDFKDLLENKIATFAGPKRNEETPALYSAHGVAVNLTDAGNFDKTVLEALACDTPVVVASPAFAELVPTSSILSKLDAGLLKEALARILALSDTEYVALSKQGRAKVEEKHSLAALADTLAGVYR